jgi:hypothetical protein
LTSQEKNLQNITEEVLEENRSLKKKNHRDFINSLEFCCLILSANNMVEASTQGKSGKEREKIVDEVMKFFLIQKNNYSAEI